MATPTPRLGLEAEYFLSEAVYATARNEIFFKTWQYACHSSQLADAGDCFVFSLFDQDLLITRDQSGGLHALYNVCQHRGHRLVTESGNYPLLVCPYHQWAYQPDGQLANAPNADAVAGFDKTKICVPSIRLEEFLGFVFVNLDDDAPSMEASYPGVKDEILKLCPDIEFRQFAHEHASGEGCNWLIAVENYNECYHCKGVHPAFAKGVIDPSSYNILPFGEGKVLHHSAKPSSDEAAWYDTSGSDYGSFFLWPATSIQIYPGGVVNNYYWRPLAVNDTRVHRGWFSDDGEVDNTLNNIIELDRSTTVAEDLEVVKNVQRGVQSRGYRPGPLVIDPKGGIDNEHSIAALHEWMREAVALEAS